MLSAFRTVRRFIARRYTTTRAGARHVVQKRMVGKNLCLVVTARSGNTHDPKIIEWGWIKS